MVPNWYLPKKLILLFDIILTITSLLLAYLIRFDFIDFYDLFWIKEYDSVITGVPSLILIRYLSFLAGRTHKGIIRHFTNDDALRIFYTVSIGTIIIGTLSILKFKFYDGSALLPKSVIIIEYLGTLFFLTSSRLFVKQSFTNRNKKAGKTINVLIYGSGKMGIITKTTLERDGGNSYNIEGFIDDDPQKEGLLIDRKLIIHPKNLNSQLTKFKINTVIIAIKDPSIVNKKKLIDICLKNQVKVKTVPSVEDWFDGNFSAQQIKDVNINDLLGRNPIKLPKKNIQNDLINKTILVTGAAGSIGSEIVRQLLNLQPKKVILLDQAESALYDLNQELKRKNKSKNTEIIVGDITRKERLTNIFKSFRPEIIFHAAAYKHVPLMENNPTESIRTNLLGTKIIADLAAEHNIQKFILVSTDKAVNPTNVMGASKRSAEMYCQALNQEHKTKFIITRFGNVLGSNGSVIPLFKKQINSGGPVTVTHPDVTRFFMTIKEACQLVLEASSMGNGGEIYVFDMGESIKIIDLAKKMIQLAGLKIDKDIKIKIIGLRPGEKMFEETLNINENTSKTHHPKILIGKVSVVNLLDINKSIEKLKMFIKSQQNDQIIKQMKEIIPEYISNNSEFSKFDK
ncbi:MAG: polysaccharide biosynthesis protein [Bacteroidetes bacterium MED-G20]|nr:MAG: polysaccharide biosynthesis protein [Bacteroidetes bacterium MED-G20]